MRQLYEVNSLSGSTFEDNDIPHSLGIVLHIWLQMYLCMLTNEFSAK